MSMIAMVTPTPHAPFRRDFWDEGRSTDYTSSRPRSDADRIALPSIRQVNLAFSPVLAVFAAVELKLIAAPGFS